MSANVTIRAKFHGDWRPKYLAQILGIGEGDVRWALVELWSWQTEHFTPDAPTYEVGRKELIGRFGPKGPEALVEAELALEVVPDRFYIRGTRGDDDGKGDIAWLSNKRVAGGKGGVKRAKRAAAGEVGAPARASGGRFGAQASTEAAPQHDGSTTEAEPKQGATTAEAPRNPRDPGSGIRISEISHADCAPDGEPVFGEIGKLVEHAVDRLNAARREIDPTALSIAEFEDQPGRQKLCDRLRPTPPADRKRKLDHALVVLIAEAKLKGEVGVGLLRLGMLAGDAAWPRNLAGSTRPPPPARVSTAGRSPPPSGIDATSAALQRRAAARGPDR